MKDDTNQPTHKERCGYAIISGLHFLAFVLIGSGVTTDAWRLVCAVGCFFFLMSTMSFPAEAMDAAGPEQEPDDNNIK